VTPRLPGFLRHASVQQRVGSLASCAVLFALGAWMGFYTAAAFLGGVLAGTALGVLFWVETREPRRRAEQFPVTNAQKLGYLPLFFLVAVFLGCVAERVSDAPSAGCVRVFLGWAFFGSVGLLAAFDLLQLVRLCLFALRGGAPDRFLWRERQTGRAAMLGRTGVVTERLAPSGRVRLRGELWRAEAAGGQHLEAGREVVVLEVRGLTLRVGPGPRGGAGCSGSC